MFDFTDIKNVIIPEGEVDYIKDNRDNIIWRCVLSCEVFSSLGYNHQTITSYYNESIADNPAILNPICDTETSTKFGNKWYYYNKYGTKIYLEPNELSHFKYEDLSVYPDYRDIVSVNVFTVTDEVKQISSFTKLKGEEYNIEQIPTYDNFEYYRSIPFNWNPLTGDTNISLLYTPKYYDVNLSINDEKHGIVYGEGTYQYGSEIIISTLVLSDDLTFLQWSDENTDNPRRLLVDGEKNLTSYIGQNLVLRYHMNIPLTITYTKGY